MKGGETKKTNKKRGAKNSHFFFFLQKFSSNLINNKNREEVIMSCPAGASLLAMSATVRNPGDLGAWIGAVHGRRGGGGGGGGGGVASSFGGSSNAADDGDGSASLSGGATMPPAAATAETIVTSARPVPLTWMYAWSTPPWLRQQQEWDERERGGRREGEERGGEEESPRKSPSASSSVRLADLLAPLPPGVVGPGGSGGGGGGGADSSLPSSSQQRPPARLRLSAALRPPRGSGGGYEEPRTQPAPVPLARELERRGLLPAIWFVFSRAGCDATATAIGRSRGGDDGGSGKTGGDKKGGKGKSKPSAATVTGFVDNGGGETLGHGPSGEKLAQIDAALAALSRDQPEALRPEMIPALRAGVASHHAGCLPGWKQLVEGLFQRGCLDVVVATETLAAGINMPARTTVISSLSRRRGPRGVEPLTHNELLQMGGRAGRRGFDSEGACVLLHDGSTSGSFAGGWGAASAAASRGGPEAAAALLARGPERLASRFRPSYSMALNLLATRPLAEARAFVERSFGSWMRGEGARGRELRLAAADRAAAEAKAVARELQRRAAEEAEESRAKVEAALSPGSASSAVSPSFDDLDASFSTPASTDAAASKKAAKRALRAAIRRAVARRAARAAGEALRQGLVATSSPASPDSSFQLLAAPWHLAVDLSASDANGDEAVPALAVGIDWAPKEAATGSDDGSGGSEDDDEVDGNFGKLASSSSSFSSSSSSSSSSALVAVPRTRAEGEPRGELLCLLADNRIARVQFAHVAGVKAEEAAEASAPGLSPPPLLLLAEAVLAAAAEASAEGAWKGIPGGTLAVSGTAMTAEAAAALAGGVAREEEPEAASNDGDGDGDGGPSSPPSPSPSPTTIISLFLPSADDEIEMRAARSAVREARAAARKERREAQRAGTSVKKQKKAREATALRQRQQRSRLSAAATAAWLEAESASRTAAAMRAALEEDLSATWRSFEAVVAVLESVGAVQRGGGDEEDGDRQKHQRPRKGKRQSLSPPPPLDGEPPPSSSSSSPEAPELTLSALGEVARGLAGENELWLAAVLTHEAVQALAPSELAAVLSAVAAGESTLRPGASAPYPPSRAVLSAVAATEPVRAKLARAQAAAGVDSPLALDLRLAGVVEAWASGAEWAQAAGDAAGLDAGDVARLMQRTVDLLRQAGGCRALPPGIRRDARRAAAKMYRAPISDLVQ